MTTRAGAVQDQLAVVPRQRRRRRPWPWRAGGPADRARVRGVATTVLCFAVCAGLGLQSWAALRVTGFDLGIFDQAVRAYAQFAPPRSAIKSVHHEFPPDFTLLGDHFTPLLALLAPLYWLWDDPRTLILAQAALFAAGVPVTRRIARHRFPGREVVADVAGLVYALGWPLLDSSYTGFHEVAFAVPLTLLMLERGLARRYGTAVLWAALLCLVKEDMGLVAGAYGLVLLVRARRERSARDRRAGRAAGLGLLLGGPLVVTLVVGWFLPAMGSPPGYYWSYGRIGADGGAFLARVFTEPWVVPWVAVTPPVKLVLVGWVLGTLAFLPLGSATTLLALPLLAERLLSDNGNHWPVVNHYDAFLWPILLTASLETLARLPRPHRKRLGAAALALSTGAAVFLGLGLLVTPGSWQPRPDKAALARAAELVPDGVTVEADNAVAPRLTRRTSVVLADRTPRGADWVLLGVHGRTFPFHAVEEQQARVRMLLDHGYVEVWNREGAVLLRRAETRPIPGMRVPGPDSTPVRERVPADVGHDPFGR